MFSKYYSVGRLLLKWAHSLSFVVVIQSKFAATSSTMSVQLFSKFYNTEAASLNFNSKPLVQSVISKFEN